MILKKHTSIKNHANEYECDNEPFYLIYNYNQIFPYSKFPVKKTNVGQILNYEEIVA
jgi:hypothetical protein